jgi:hypothetical protein
MRPDLAEWVEATRRRRREHVAGAAFSPGLLEGGWSDPVPARRAVASVLVTLVGDRGATVRFTPGGS